jgi:hypothetical protein
MSKIDLSVDDIISKSKVLTITKKVKKGFTTVFENPVIIAPLNARINFSEIPRPTVSQTRLFASQAVSLPETWSWRPDQIDPTVDVGARLEAKKGITPILYQASCGSCWAFALAGVISDVFMVAQKFLTLPPGAGSVPTSAISPTSILSCYRNGQSGCAGGNPAGAAYDIQTKGVYGSSCMDYSWILNNPNFNGSASQHFEASQLYSMMNSAMPNCGCVSPNNPRKKFTIKDVNALPAYSSDKGTSTLSLLNTWNTVRQWIWDNGSIVGGYVVYNNFLVNNFNDTDGVYFEDYPYDGKSKGFAGLHAVRILGWGIQKNCLLPNRKTRSDVPYWMVANSWGADWGDNGYFKIARYPYNKVAQFDALVETPDGYEIGGFVACRAGDILDVDYNKIETKYTEYIDKDRYNAGFYNKDLSIEDKAPPPPPSPPPPPPQPISDNKIDIITGDQVLKKIEEVFGKKFYENKNFITAVSVGGGILIVLILYFIFSRKRSNGIRKSRK